MTRAVADNRINAWKNAARVEKTAWRRTHGNKNYGQLLRGNGRPSDQVDPANPLPGDLSADGWIDVYQATRGFGWIATFEAVEGSITYRRTVSCHEDGPLQESPWVEWSTVDLPASPPGRIRTAWNSTVSFVRNLFA